MPCSVRLVSRGGAIGGSGVVAANLSSSIGFAIGGSGRGLFGWRRSRRSLARLGTQQLAHLGALGIPPIGEDADIPADAEVLYAQFEVLSGLGGVAQLDARMLALPQRGLDRLQLGLQLLGMAVLPGLD